MQLNADPLGGTVERLRYPLGLLTALGIVVAVAALCQARSGNIAASRALTVPFFAIIFASWAGALTTATNVAKYNGVRAVLPIPQFYGLVTAARSSPWWALMLSALGLLGVALLGESGSSRGLPDSPHEARVIGAVALIFFALSLPPLTSNHPGARWGAAFYEGDSVKPSSSGEAGGN